MATGTGKTVVTEEKLADMLDASNLSEKQLFFPKDIQRLVEELGSFQQPENYQKIQDRMKEKYKEILRILTKFLRSRRCSSASQSPEKRVKCRLSVRLLRSS